MSPRASNLPTALSIINVKIIRESRETVSSTEVNLQRLCSSIRPIIYATLWEKEMLIIAVLPKRRTMSRTVFAVDERSTRGTTYINVKSVRLRRCTGVTQIFVEPF